MKFIEKDAPEGIVVHWFQRDEDTVVVYLHKDLDEVTRRRYLAEAQQAFGVEPRRRRRGLVALLPVASAGGHSKTVSTAVMVGGGVVAAGIAAATVLPAVLSDHHSPSARPRAEGPPGLGSRPKYRDQTPQAPQPAPAGKPPPVDADPPAPGPFQHPIRKTARTVSGLTGVQHPIRSIAPTLPLPVPRQSRPLLDLELPPAGVTVRLRPTPQVRVRLGGGQTPLGSQP